MTYIHLVKAQSTSGYLAGKLLVASPAMGDPRFAQSVILICAHDSSHAFGLVVNSPLPDLTLGEVLSQMDVKRVPASIAGTHVLWGGPVEEGNGFVLHSLDFTLPEKTLRVGPDLGFSASRDALLAMAEDNPPACSLLALGMASWGPGQLDQELTENAWLVAEADPELIFNEDHGGKWNRALARMGIDPGRYSDASGHA